MYVIFASQAAAIHNQPIKSWSILII